MKHFLHLSYKGTKYSGWQRQKNVPSVQQTIEEALTKTIKQKCTIQGCGRTDTGVHSSNYIAQVNFEKETDFNFVKIINKVLPNDVVIHKCFVVDNNSQAQYHVNKRRYDYYIHFVPNPLLEDFSTNIDTELNLSSMQNALSTIVGAHDFRGFCKTPDKHDSTVCRISKADIYHENDRIQIRIEGNRFLRSMVRLIVGNLILIGQGKLTNDKWLDVLSLKSNFNYFNLAYPQGLHLSGIYYDKLKFDTESIFSISKNP
ncbi:MAG: tRNA pseudouridine(38-40) synthase TruA [Saprospiraceae bacterium]